MGDEDFVRRRAKVQRLVDRLYAKHRHDGVFNGKWYAAFLAEDARRIAGSTQYARGELAQRLTACLLMTLDYSGPWAHGLHSRLDQAAALLNPCQPSLIA